MFSAGPEGSIIAGIVGEDSGMGREVVSVPEAAERGVVRVVGEACSADGGRLRRGVVFDSSSRAIPDVTRDAGRSGEPSR